MSTHPLEGLGVPSWVTDAHACEVGKLIGVWAFIQRIVLGVLLTLLRGKKVARETFDIQDWMAMLVSAGMSDRTAIGLIKSMVRSYRPKTADEFDKIADKLLGDGETRDIIAHAMWDKGKRPGSISVSVLKTVGKVKHTRHEYTVKELHEVLLRFYDHFFDMMAWLIANELPIPIDLIPASILEQHNLTPPRPQDGSKNSPKSEK